MLACPWGCSLQYCSGRHRRPAPRPPPPRSDLRKNHGKEEARARDLFYALWIPDLFMQRVEVRGAQIP